MSIIKQNDTILFQGDSITDVGRQDSPDGLGGGYVSIINGFWGLDSDRPDVKILNRGIGGDRTEELLARWKEDCEDLKAEVLSLKIGVNDVWRILGEWEGQTYIEPPQYEENYRQLLDRALASGVRQLILCSPTTIDDSRDTRLNALLAERRDIVIKLAHEYSALYVPFQETQLQLLKEQPHIQWTVDGCHPTLSGHAALAKCWLDKVL